MNQLVHAVAYLHSKGVVHRDLKPDNVLVDVPNRSLKIIDFGLTGLIRRNSLMTTSCGSSYYSAPEVTYGNGAGYDGAKADAWALGILAYILLTGAHPFVDNNGQLMTAMMRQGMVEYPQSLSRAAMHFTSRLLMLDPAKRYSVAQVSLHPWLTGKPAPTSAPHPPPARKEQPSQDADVSRLSTRRMGTFSVAQPHKSLFGRSHSDRHNQSSPSLATRRRSSYKSANSSSFFWFRRQHTNQHQQQDDQHSALEEDSNSSQNGSRKGSVERTRGLLEGFASRREGRLTFDFITSRTHTDNSDGVPRARRQLSLTSRTKALLMRTSLGSLEQQQQQ
ncbi:Serine/threonine-protein kinase [Gracilaria domingensis]|nr:Serine/threonine-protein kinase [Gracilaria domingensis]